MMDDSCYNKIENRLQKQNKTKDKISVDCKNLVENETQHYIFNFRT